MRLEMFDGDANQRPLGAIVVVGDANDVLVDAGPADGSPLFRLRLTRGQALALSANLRAVANGRDEEILLSDA